MITHPVGREGDEIQLETIPPVIVGSPTTVTEESLMSLKLLEGDTPSKLTFVMGTTTSKEMVSVVEPAMLDALII